MLRRSPLAFTLAATRTRATDDPKPAEASGGGAAQPAANAAADPHHQKGSGGEGNKPEPESAMPTSATGDGFYTPPEVLDAATPSKRIFTPLDFLVLQPVMEAPPVARVVGAHTACITWLAPVEQLQQRVHKRYEVEAVATDKVATRAGAVAERPLGLLSMVVTRNTSRGHGFVSRLLDQSHNTVSFRSVVVDRQHWRRSAWCYASYVPSFTAGTIPRRAFGLPHIYDDKRVTIDAAFDAQAARYTRYSASLDGVVSVALEDSGSALIGSGAATTPCFTDNESALAVLGLPQEFLMFTDEGGIFRQPAWSPLPNPNVAALTACDVHDPDALRDVLCGPLPDTPPIAAWLLDDTGTTNLYQAELAVEDEQDSSGAVTHSYGDGGLRHRVTARAINRYLNFRDDVRRKVYAENSGAELPRS